MIEPLDLESRTLDQARELWLKHMKQPLPQHKSPSLLARAVAYHLQCRAQGGLSQTQRRRLDDLADRFAEDRNFIPIAAERPKTGSVLIREWNGEQHAVTVTDTGFIYAGKPFASLTAIAKAITGTHWNGPRFFRLTETDEAKSP